MDVFVAFCGMIVLWFVSAVLSAWWFMLALGNAYNANMIDIAPGFWDTFSVSIFLSGFIAMAAFRGAQNTNS